MCEEVRDELAGERDSDSTFPAGSDRAESLFCCLLKSFGCVFLMCSSFGFVFLIQCSSTAKAVNCPKQGTDDRGFLRHLVDRKYSVN